MDRFAAPHAIVFQQKRRLLGKREDRRHDKRAGQLKLLRMEGEKPSFSYAEEELVVESIAFTVCGSMGLDASSYSVPYLTSWAEEAELETIQAAAATIDRVAKRIEDAFPKK